MKTISACIAALFICFLGSTVSSAQTYKIETHEVHVVKADSAGDVLLIHVNNLTNKDLNIHWKLLSNTVAFTGWRYQFCDLNTCYTTTATIPNSTTCLVEPSSSSAFNLSIISYEHTAASGQVQVAMWDVSTPNNIDTLLFLIDATRLGVQNKEVPATAFNLFPNPSTSSINLETSGNDFIPNRAVIINAFGQQVVTQALNGNENTLNIEALAKGIYIVRIQDKNGREATRQFVKQ